jgi:hypothetical protein
MGRRDRPLRIILAPLPLVLALGCYSTGDGPEPPTSALYFPVALAVSPGGKALYIANSDFDLQFNSGSVQVLDLERIRTALAPIWSAAGPIDRAVCQSAGLDLSPETVVYPAPCTALDIGSPPDQGGSLVKRQAKIGAFATDLLYVCQPDANQKRKGADCKGTAPGDGSRARVFVPVRGEPSLTFFDVDDDRGGFQEFHLECGQEGNDGHCDTSHRPGLDPNDNTRNLTMPVEPFSVAVTSGAEAIVVSHQTTGSVSLFTSTSGASSSSPGLTVTDTDASKLKLQFVLGGLPLGALGLAPIPVPGVFLKNEEYRPGFFLGYRIAAEIDVLRYADDGQSCLDRDAPCPGPQSASPPRPFLVRSAQVGISANARGADSRGIAVDESPRAACESPCQTALDACLAPCSAAYDACAAACSGSGAGDCTAQCLATRTTCDAACESTATACFTPCAAIPLPIYIANRDPATLLVGETLTAAGNALLQNASTTNELPNMYDSVPLSAGPSRVVIGKIQDENGVKRTRVFIVCFESRTIFVYDPESRRMEATIRTGRGPQSLAFDPVAPLAYVGHFTDSYIGVIDLDQTHPDRFETMVASIGVPQPPQDSK